MKNDIILHNNILRHIENDGRIYVTISEGTFQSTDKEKLIGHLMVLCESGNIEIQVIPCYDIEGSIISNSGFAGKSRVTGKIYMPHKNIMREIEIALSKENIIGFRLTSTGHQYLLYLDRVENEDTHPRDMLESLLSHKTK